MAETEVFRVLGSLTLVVIVILALAWFARRTGWAQGKPQLRLKILSSQRLGARSHITIVEVDNTQLVLGVTPTQINLLHTLPARDAAVSAHDTCADTELKAGGPRLCPPVTNPDASTAHTAPDPRAGAHSVESAAQTATKSDEGTLHPFKRLLARKMMWLLVPVLLTLSIVPDAVVAQTTLPALTAGPTGADGSQTWSLSIQTLMLLTMMSFLPAMLLTMTGFTRIIIVLGLLRNAMGTGASPPNSVLIGLALFLTFFTMSPVFDQVYSTAWQPLSEGRIEFGEALSLGAEPLREFMFHQTREADLSLFANMANMGEFQSPDEVPLRVLVPSFVTSELKTAFQIGFTIFIPFLIIDLVIASILMSLGMMMVPPVTISLPFKLMLFVLADGWHLLLGSLARSFYQ